MLKQNHEVTNIWYLSHCIAFDAQQPFSANLKGLEWFYVQSVFTFSVSTNRVGVVNFVMPARHKHSTHLRCARLTVSQLYKLTKTHQLQKAPTHQVINSQIQAPISLQTQQPINSSTQQPFNLYIYQFINTYQHINSKVKSFILFYNLTSISTPF